jgi:hypothetical protein
MFKNEYSRYPGQYSGGGYDSGDDIHNYGECVGDNNPNVSKCGYSNEFENVISEFMKFVPADPAHNHNCGDIGDGSDCNPYAGSNTYYSYDPIHVCPDGEFYCAVLCFHTSETGMYKCIDDNPGCNNGGGDMGQENSDYCVYFDPRNG